MVGAGLLIFPMLPLLWEARAARRRARVARLAAGILTFRDRLVLRTVALNLVFLAALLAIFPQASFSALATRGDWFPDGREGAGAQMARAGLFGAASRLEWLYRALRHNPYEEHLDRSRREKDTADERPEPAPRPTMAPTPEPPEAETAKEPVPETPERDRAIERTADGIPVWPLPPRLHSAVLGLPSAPAGPLPRTPRRCSGHAARSVPATRSCSPRWARPRATRSWSCRATPAPTAATSRGRGTPGTRRASAAAGRSRRDLGRGPRRAGRLHQGVPHALSLRPARGAGRHALPRRCPVAAPRPALDRGEFFRQPMLRADFFAEGFELLSPRRSQATVSGSLDVVLKNPRRRYLLAHRLRSQGGDVADCDVSDGLSATVRCGFASPGTYRVQLFSAGRPDTTHRMVGELEVQSR